MRMAAADLSTDVEWAASIADSTDLSVHVRSGYCNLCCYTDSWRTLRMKGRWGNYKEGRE
jgi:hypothetical protein